MPNVFAYIMLFSYPIFVFILFKLLSRPIALIASILVGYLCLPAAVEIDFPLLPAFDKDLIPALSAAVMCLLFPDVNRWRRGYSKFDVHTKRTLAKLKSSPPRRTNRLARFSNLQADKVEETDKQTLGGRRVGYRIDNALIALLFITPFITVSQNSESYNTGAFNLSGLRLYDAFSMVLTAFVSILPYLLARRFLSRPNHHVILLLGFCAAGILYSFPVLFEARMSPQLSNWIYGFLREPFAVVHRWGGFRPVVFLHGGLWLAIFIAMTFIGALALWRYDRSRGRWIIAAIWLFVTLVFCRSLGSLMIAILIIPVALFFTARMQIIVASIVAFVVLLYPMLRGVDLIPVNSVTAIAKTFSAERAQSFDFRIRNENKLLARAQVKPLAGWGGWGRSRVYDPITGRDLSITDGTWIIIVGYSGWLGYIAIFGLLTLPIFRLTFLRHRFEVTYATSGLCLALAANLIDLIPNATLTPITWLIAGAVAGRTGSGVKGHRSLKHPKQIRREGHRG